MVHPSMSALITDHAVIRFLERAYGMGELIAAARDEMTKGATPAVDFSAPVAIVHGCRLIIRNGSVITVLPKADGLRDKVRPHERRGVN
jgi:hypothetical protein